MFSRRSSSIGHNQAGAQWLAAARSGNNVEQIEEET